MFDFLRKLKSKVLPLAINYQYNKNIKGLWHFEFTIESETDKHAKLVLLKDDQVIFQVPQFTLQNKNFLAINTHLLKNGDHNFEIELSTANKTFHRSFQLNVSNVSDLAKGLAEYMKSTNCQIAFLNEVNSTCFTPTDSSLLPWFEQKNTEESFKKIIQKYAPNEQEQTALLDFKANGYTIIKNGISKSLVEACKLELEDAAKKEYQGYKEGSSQRLEQLHDKYPNIRKLWLHENVVRYLTMIFDTKPLACQTLGYVYGSQQDLHQDTIHLTPYPAGYMCGVWIPLEDVKPNSGELMVAPKSHVLKRILRKDVDCAPVRNGDWSEFTKKVVPTYPELLNQAGLTVEPYMAKAGDILIWHENLIHGGSVRKDLSVTRKSIVSHYFADGSVAYYDSTGVPGYMFTQESI